MDSKAVSRALRAVVWPILRDQGFGAFSSRSAWRTRDRLTDVVNFQSFNRYNADVLGCSTFSFAINLGVFIADAQHGPTFRSPSQPDEAACHIRRRLYPPLPELKGAPDIWLIDPTGANIERTVQGAALHLLEVALPWFAAFRDRQTVLAILLGQARKPDAATWLPGNAGSQALNRAIGLLAQAMGDQALATSHLRRAEEQEAHWQALMADITGRKRGRSLNARSPRSRRANSD